MPALRPHSDHFVSVTKYSLPPFDIETNHLPPDAFFRTIEIWLLEMLDEPASQPVAAINDARL
jgi:predicted membrane chloride channel (bestrophin family)